MSTQAVQSLQQALIRSPMLYPYDLDASGQVGHFFQLAEEDYSAASFLDHRVLRPGMPNGPIPWPAVEQAVAGLPMRCDFIFHISHCGSTLISRLLGLAPSCFAVREPLLLRKLAVGQATEHTGTLLRLWSRTFSPDQRALIKATSFVSECSSSLLHWVSQSRALLMYVPLSTFVPAVIDGAMSDVNEQIASRLKRLQAQGVLLGKDASNMHPGEAVAVSWLCEVLSLVRTAAAHPSRCMWLNFDEYLRSPATHLTQVLQHFRINADADAMLQSPLNARYSKRIEVAYTPDFRQQLLTASRQKFHAEIAKAREIMQRNDVQAALATCPVDMHLDITQSLRTSKRPASD